jgi:hypothetical protein
MDFIPVVSTVTNLVDLAQKFIFHISKSTEPTEEKNESHYFEYIKNKNTQESLVRLIPVVGNIFNI